MFADGGSAPRRSGGAGRARVGQNPNCPTSPKAAPSKGFRRVVGLSRSIFRRRREEVKRGNRVYCPHRDAANSGTFQVFENCPTPLLKPSKPLRGAGFAGRAGIGACPTCPLLLHYRRCSGTVGSPPAPAPPPLAVTENKKGEPSRLALAASSHPRISQTPSGQTRLSVAGWRCERRSGASTIGPSPASSRRASRVEPAALARNPAPGHWWAP